MKKVISLVLVISFLLVGCGSNTDSFTYGISRSLESLDLSQASYQQTFQLFTDIYQTPMEVNDKGELVNGLITDIKVSDDQQVYTLSLRDDAKWVDSNGEEKGNVTSNDFVYGYQRMVDPNTASPYSFIFEPIVNATEISQGKKDKSELGVKALDDYTLEIDLTTPTPYFNSLLAFSTFSPQPEAAIEEYGKDYASDADKTWYSGAYYINDYDPQGETSLVKNELYYDKDVTSIDNITFKVSEDVSASYSAFKTGELDYAEIGSNTEDIKEAKANGDLKEQETGYSFYGHINQLESANTSNKNLKMALEYGFDRENIKEASFGEVNTTIDYILPKDFTNIAYDGKDYRDYANASLISFDKDKADKYFDAYMSDMGYTDRSQVEVNFISSDQESNKKIAEAIQASFKQLFGITVNVQALPSEQFDDARQKGDYDLFILAWGPDYADPSTYLSLWQSTSSSNDTSYNNPEYDKLYDEALKETDVTKRFEDFAKLEQMLIDDGVLIPFYQKTNNYLLNKEYNLPLHLFMQISHKYVTKIEE